MMSMCDEDAQLQALFDGVLKLPNGEATNTLLVFGAPNYGKTRFAFKAMLCACKRWPRRVNALSVQNRVIADRLSDDIIRELGVTDKARPVGTLSALAFSLISARSRMNGSYLPKLLNGAEQDAILRQVVKSHIDHVLRGENGDCSVCDLLQNYFSTKSWVSVLTDLNDLTGLTEKSNSVKSTEEDSLSSISSAFMHQLRDMLARLDELGVSEFDESKVFSYLDNVSNAGNSGTNIDTNIGTNDSQSSEIVSRCKVQWNLAFALRKEYRNLVSVEYPHDFRLDSSSLLVEGANAVEELKSSISFDNYDCPIPEVLIVDDFHDVTLAGLSFIEALSKAGTKIVLLANPDESVQSFRGSYPDYVISAARLEPLCAAEIKLTDNNADNNADNSADNAVSSYSKISALNLLSSRVSFSISSQLDSSIALPKRPWKLKLFEGAYPIEAVTNMVSSNPKTPYLSKDNSLTASLYRSTSQELDAIVWDIKQSHVSKRRAWSDMALIAHDNSIVRAFGERLKQDGVPVRYSLVTKPLSEEPFVQGLFAFIELAIFVSRGSSYIFKQIENGKTLQSIALFVRERLTAIVDSPLVALYRYSGETVEFLRPARMSSVESCLRSLVSLASMVDADVVDSSVSGEVAPLKSAIKEWNLFVDKVLHESNINSQKAQQISIDNRLFDANPNEDSKKFSLNSCYLLLLLSACKNIFADSLETSNNSFAEKDDYNTIISILESMAPHDPHVLAFSKVWQNICKFAIKLNSHSYLRTAKYALSQAWQMSDVASLWQKLALINNREGRLANDRLDAAMRLFDYVQSFSNSNIEDFREENLSTSGKNSVDIIDFIAQVRGMEIEADSLASVAPVTDAVTLTTPAGAAGNHWPLVWMPSVEQKVWPNLASRSTMFGVEILTQIVLESRNSSINSSKNNKISLNIKNLSYNDKATIFAAEQRSFLTAVTRATETLNISAVKSDECTPSDFLYSYLPEWYFEDGEGTEFTQRVEPFAGIDMDVRGLVAAARARLVRASNASNISEVSNATADSQTNKNYVNDACQALKLLRNHGVSCANPEQWDFMHADGESTENINVDSTAEDNNSTEVSLSPSMVDSLWACPVCGLLDRKFSGPQSSSVAASFGTLIHETARWASEEKHFDIEEVKIEEFTNDKNESSEQSVYSSQVKLISYVAKQMIEYYHSIAPDFSEVHNLEERYKAIEREHNIDRAIYAIAQYFVTSKNACNYNLVAKKSETGVVESLSKSSKNLESSIGDLVEAYVELPISAHISLDDITKVVNETLSNSNSAENAEKLSKSEVFSIMGALVGGWPDGAKENLNIHIHGRIDREELRKLDDGTKILRLIDYKTGKPISASAVFNDLQLVCYQLALAFADENPLINMPNPPRIARSVLFHVVEKDYPAQDRNVAENIYQQPIFKNNMLNTDPFEPRISIKDINKLSDIDWDAIRENPGNISEKVWKAFLSLPTCAKWSLAMISRVFYAAAIIKSHKITAKPTPQHMRYCRNRNVCPACAGQVDTVYEVRK